MRLVDELRRQLGSEPSYFRRHLIEEDLGRLEILTGTATVHDDPGAFVAAGLRIGWTPEDRRTHELRPALEPLLLAIHERMRLTLPQGEVEALDDRICELWQSFELMRMDRLVGCLARVPRPKDAG